MCCFTFGKHQEMHCTFFLNCSRKKLHNATLFTARDNVPAVSSVWGCH